jgi:Fe2+ transport system protein FeoA
VRFADRGDIQAVNETSSLSAPDQGRRDPCDLCFLSQARAGVSVRIKQLCAAPEVQNRLREIGLGEDQVIKLIACQTGFICQVCNARLAISEQLARLILVEPVLARVKVS